MSTARKAAYLALGAGASAAESVRGLQKRVIDLSGEVASRAGGLRDLRGKTIAIDPKSVRELIEKSATRARAATASARERSVEACTRFEKRGEQLAKRIERSMPTKRAAEETKKARSRVKSAAKQVKRAVEADVDAAKAAVETAVEQTG
ncbi:MAG: hypothetical protein HY775_08970 [Acidobacteria bacterium]|nr:hypothetical protein [Acidobacteriota bacterium]